MIRVFMVGIVGIFESDIVLVYVVFLVVFIGLELIYIVKCACISLLFIS